MATIIGNQLYDFSPIMPEEFGEHLTKRSETIPSYRNSPDPTDSQLHDSASSIQFTLVFYRLQVGELGSLILCSVTHFCVDVDVCFGLKHPNELS